MSIEQKLVLASGSVIRRQLLENAGLHVEVQPARVDEETLRQALTAEGVSPRDMADALAEAKAQKVSGRCPGAIVIGCDQILEHRGEALGKAASVDALRSQLERLRGDRHVLWSAAVLYRDGQPLWRVVDKAEMTMAAISDRYLEAYLTRNGDQLLQSVGGYMLEGEGVRLFSEVRGSYFTVLGLPLLPVLQQLAGMEVIDA